MADFDDFLEDVKAGLGGLVADTLGDFADSAKERAAAFLEDTKEDLQKWRQQLADGEISLDDFEFLVKGKADLAEMSVLLERGAAKVAVDRFRLGLVQLIRDSAAGVLG